MTELIRASGATDFEEIAAFQRRAFGHEWLKSERHRLQRPEYYRWKYSPPAGSAWLVFVRSGQELVAMLAAVPFEQAAGQGGSTTWQICDIATDPRFRRRGLFARCLAALAEAVPTDVTFCFPNKQSRAGLIKAGYAVSSTLRLRGGPILGLAMRQMNDARASSIDAVECGSAFQIDPRRHGSIRRSPEFLRWRYGAHPFNSYLAVTTSHTGSIIRRLFSGRVALVLETWGGSDEERRAGRDAARRWAKGAGCMALLWAQDPLAAAQAGRTRLDAWQRPWDILCYARSNSQPSPRGTTERLHVHLGDWDAV